MFYRLLQYKEGKKPSADEVSARVGQPPTGQPERAHLRMQRKPRQPASWYSDVSGEMTTLFILSF